MNEQPSAKPVERVDAFDLMAESFDSKTSEPVTRKLIVCAAPRTGSYRLTRLLHAADLGTPLEYFNPRFIPTFCQRWGVPFEAQGQPDMQSYIAALMQRRSHRGLFSTKLQYWQFDPQLRNAIGRSMFEGATFVHLMRADVQMQCFSLHAAMATGRWEFTDREMIEPQYPASALTDAAKVVQAMKLIVNEDARWRMFFAYAGIAPILLSMDDLVERAEETVERIAGRMGLSFDRERLREMNAVDKKYKTNSAEIATVEKALAATFARLAFESTPTT